MNGRVGAAIQLYQEMSIEAISQVKTEALSGYAFDFMATGAGDQDVNSISFSTTPSHIPTQEEHEAIVYDLREASRPYWALLLIVRAIVLFREWHDEEESLIKSVYPRHYPYQLLATNICSLQFQRPRRPQSRHEAHQRNSRPNPLRYRLNSHKWQDPTRPPRQRRLRHRRSRNENLLPRDHNRLYQHPTSRRLLH